MDKFNKLSLPATIIIASLILGGFFYATQVNKQQSIDRQVQEKQYEEQPSSKQSVANKARCQKDGQQFYERKKQEEVFEGATVYTVFGNQSYSFNQELNTCLISWEDSSLIRGSDGYDIHIRHITDIYNNKDVYAWWQKTLSPYDKLPIDYLGNELEYNQKLQFYGLY